MQYRSGFARKLGLAAAVLAVAGICGCGPEYKAKPPMGYDTITGARADSLAAELKKTARPVNTDSVKIYPVPE
jgi:hypothetical protein